MKLDFRYCAMAVIIWSALGAPSGLAQVRTFCGEPVTPFCVNRSGTFDDAVARERCRGEVQDYIAGLDRYVKCLSQQAREAEARGRTVAKRFECMEQGRKNCR